MPTLRPSNPIFMSSGVKRLNLDGDIHAGGEVELLQLVDRLGGRLHDVEQALVGANFELVHRLFVHVRGAIDREFLDAGWQRNGADHLSAGALRGFDDFGRRCIEHSIVECLQSNSDSLSSHGWLSSYLPFWSRTAFFTFSGTCSKWDGSIE